jgi:hypothetical protein
LVFNFSISLADDKKKLIIVVIAIVVVVGLGASVAAITNAGLHPYSSGSGPCPVFPVQSFTAQQPYVSPWHWKYDFVNGVDGLFFSISLSTSPLISPLFLPFSFFLCFVFHTDAFAVSKVDLSLRVLLWLGTQLCIMVEISLLMLTARFFH